MIGLMPRGMMVILHVKEKSRELYRSEVLPVVLWICACQKRMH